MKTAVLVLTRPGSIDGLVRAEALWRRHPRGEGGAVWSFELLRTGNHKISIALQRFLISQLLQIQMHVGSNCLENAW